MSNELVHPPYFVKVFPPNPQIGSEMQLWAVMTGASEAVATVEKSIPPGWMAELILGGVTKEQASKIKLRYGDASEVTQVLK